MLAKLEKGEYQNASKLPDTAFKSISDWDSNHGVSRCRINYAGPPAQAWCAAAGHTTPGVAWIEVNLGKRSQVFGILIQGRGEGGQWTTAFSVSGSLDGKDYQKIGDFIGNTDATTVKKNIFKAPVSYQFIRLYVTSYQAHPSLRWDVLYE